MTIERKRKDIISFSKRHVSDGIYPYDFMDEKSFDNDLMGEVYSQTFKTIGIIINDFRRRHDQNENRQGYRTNFSQSHIESNYSNIIPLIGERRTGKTSALETIVMSLKHNSKDARQRRNELMFGTQSDNRSVDFTVLECIDADDEVTIFENVIMRMYKIYAEQVRELSDSCGWKTEDQLRKIGTKFEFVLRSYSLTKKNVGAPIQELREGSVELDIRFNFKELVNEFLTFLHEGNKESFLIIPIDDLDMFVNSAYTMMEEIHQYLMQNNIIVIITIDLTRFLYICKYHFFNMDPFREMLIKESKKTDTSQYFKKYVSTLAQDYVDKILPTENRIYLPRLHTENRKVFLRKYEKDIGNEPGSSISDFTFDKS